MTTFRIGGPAEWVGRPRNAGQTAAILEVARNQGIPVRCVGLGSNLLVSDEGLGGLVLLMRGLDRIDFDGTAVTVGAGVTNARILGSVRSRGLGGLECLVGYPGTLGGAVRMNAGGSPGYIAERVQWVRGIDGEGAVVTRSVGDCGFGYRSSALGDLVVTEVRLRLPAVDPEEFALRCGEIRDRKRLAQPLESRSAGCVWKNPPGERSAGLLVQDADAKGLVVGGAEVSPHHGNFIVNRGGATCADVLALMDEVHHRVLDSSGISLEREVIHWSDVPVAVGGR